MWKIFIAWMQAHMLWHIASRPEADPRDDIERDLPKPLDAGDFVAKRTGYQFVGVIVSKFQTTTGATRYVVEHATAIGLLHILNEDQLERINGDEVINRREQP